MMAAPALAVVLEAARVPLAPWEAAAAAAAAAALDKHISLPSPLVGAAPDKVVPETAFQIQLAQPL